MEGIMTSAPSLPVGGNERVPRGRRPLRRWIIPVGGGLLCSVLVVVGTPHVVWYLRVLLAAIAFLYIAGQSAAYLWSGKE
jgi:hypothetical protein